MKNNLIFWIVAIIIFIPLIIFSTHSAKKKGRENFEKFDSAEINSRIESIDNKYHGTHIVLSDGRDFVAYFLTDEKLNEGKIFDHTATNGDSVIKKSYSDTLYLIKGNRKLAYLFGLEYRNK